jgi:hypothetical protein
VVETVTLNTWLGGTFELRTTDEGAVQVEAEGAPEQARETVPLNPPTELGSSW